jgi:dTDP-4-amino-4,6-dideoxygalactose transaminase
LHESFGTNGRMTEMQAAIGRIQLRRLDGWVAVRRRHAAILTEGFSNISALRATIPPPEVEHAYYKYYVFLRPEFFPSEPASNSKPKTQNSNLPALRDRLMAEINAEGIPCYSGSCSEIYLEKAFDGMRPASRLPLAKELGETSLMFLVHPTLTKRDMHRTVHAVAKAMA